MSDLKSNAKIRNDDVDFQSILIKIDPFLIKINLFLIKMLKFIQFLIKKNSNSI